MKPRTRLIAALFVLALIVCAGVSALSWRSAQMLVHPARWNPATTPEDVGLAYERVTFESAEDGLTLVGWWMPAEEPRSVVIVLHGYGDSKNQSLEVAPFLHEAGHHVLAFDFRAHGESEGDHTTMGLDEVVDLEAAIAFAKARDPNASKNLAVLGFSMGAATAINAAPATSDIDAIVADSAFASLTNIASNSITHFTDLPKYPFGPLSVVFAGWIVGKDIGDNVPLRAIERSTAPVLVIQGLADNIAFPRDDGEAIAAAAPIGSELWLVPGATHVQAHRVAPAEYERLVLAFLEERLFG